MKKLFLSALLTLPALLQAGQFIFQLQKIDANKAVIGPYANEPLTVYFDRKGGENFQDMTTDAEGKIHIPLTSDPVIASLYIRWNRSPECNEEDKYLVAEANFMPYLAKRLRSQDPALNVNKTVILQSTFTSIAGRYYPSFSTSGLNFKTGSAIIEETTANRAILKKMAEFIAGNQTNFPCKKLEIRGYTDSDGDEEANQRLSEDRAQAVWNDLESYEALDMSLVTPRGFGESALVRIQGVEDKSKSRRVEIVIAGE